MTQKTLQPSTNVTFDIRVRERNLKQGLITEKDVEKFLVALPDVSDQIESFSVPQPALEQPESVEDLGDDEDEDEDESDNVDGAAAATDAGEPEATA